MSFINVIHNIVTLFVVHISIGNLTFNSTADVAFYFVSADWSIEEADTAVPLPYAKHHCGNIRRTQVLIESLNLQVERLATF